MGDGLTSSVAALLVLGLLVGVVGGAFYYRYQGVEVKSYQGQKVRATSYYDILSNKLTGIVKNIGDQKLSHVKIKARFYDYSDTLVSTGSDEVSNLHPDEKYRFKIRTKPDITFGRVRLQASIKQ